jgi:multiple sugar transport system permease protein
MAAHLSQATLKQKPGVGRVLSTRLKNIPLPALLIAPTFLIVFGLLIYPMLFGAVLGFSNRVMVGTEKFRWIGFTNYIKLLTPGSDFLTAAGVTLRFAVVDVVAEFAIGLGLALLLNRDFFARNVFRVLILIPMMVPPLAAGLMWRFMYDQSQGIYAFFIRALGGNPPVFLGDVHLALYAVVATEVWRSSPFMVLVLLAALQAVPKELQEAAQVDGANAFLNFWYITLPFISPVIAVALLFRTVDSLRTFDLVYLMTGGGPGTITEVVSMYIYRWGFRNFRLGFTSASSMILLIATLMICAVYLRMLVRRQAYVQGD